MTTPNPILRPTVQQATCVGLVLVHTGEGKGKTTAALGLALRAVGHGMKVHIVQFIKGSRLCGEMEGLARLGIPLERAGEGFTWEVRSEDRQRALAAWGMERARAALLAGVDILILDEVNVALGKGFLELRELLDLLDGRPDGVHVVCTGRYAPEALRDRADLVTVHTLVKHPFERGIRAQPGVEF